jgi:FMN phosphatase YigB (HAD superfamily)
MQCLHQKDTAKREGIPRLSSPAAHWYFFSTASLCPQMGAASPTGRDQTGDVGAVLFDLFETLFTEWRGDVDGPPPRWGAPAAELGVPDEEFRTGWTALQDRRLTGRFSYRDALVEICNGAGREPPMAVICELDELRCADKSACFVAVDTAITHMLHALRSAGWKTAIVSNCSVEEVSGFRASPLASLVDDVVWSFDVGVAKPDPAIYTMAAERLDERPENCSFVGDGSFGELDGAVHAGVRAIWASWYVNRWPDRLAHPRRVTAERAGHVEAAHPSDIVALIS